MLNSQLINDIVFFAAFFASIEFRVLHTLKFMGSFYPLEANNSEWSQTMERTFGIEIEAFGLNRYDVAQAITNAGIECRNEVYNHMTTQHWKVVSDRSINGALGFEVVSPVLRGEDGMAQVVKVMDALKAAGAQVNKSCGLHVHIGAADLTIREFKNIARNYLMFEDFFDAVMPKSRRGDSNQYIQSLRRKFGGYGHDAARAGMQAVAACKTIDAIIKVLNGEAWDHNARYYKLNLTAFWRHPTIEFRQHAGTVEAEKACNWIRLVMSFVDKAATSRVRPRSTRTTEVAASTVFTQFFECFGQKSLRPYFSERRRHFEAQEQAGA